MSLSVTKLIEIPCQGAPKPYKMNQFSKEDKQQEYRLEFNLKYGQLDKLYEALFRLYRESKASNAFHYEVTGEVEEMISVFIQSLNNQGASADSEIRFNKTRVKSFAEKFCFQREFKVKRILPLVEIDGMLAVTNERVYF